MFVIKVSTQQYYFFHLLANIFINGFNFWVFYYSKEKDEKVLESKATYDAWMDKKKGFVSTSVIKAKMEEQKKKKEEEKRKEKQKEAEEVRLWSFFT